MSTWCSETRFTSTCFTDLPCVSGGAWAEVSVGCALGRTMLDGSAAAALLEDLSEEELLAGGAAWPTTWVLLQPSSKGVRHQSPAHPVAVPLRIDNVRPQPEFCLPVSGSRGQACCAYGGKSVVKSRL